MVGRRFSRLTVVQEILPRKRLPCGQTRIRWTCLCDCGEETEIFGDYLRSGHIRSCGCLSKESASSRQGERHPSWKGGRHKNRHGYINVTRPPAFPGNEDRHRLSALEHHIVMSQHLGRPLHKDETVHHKNGIRDDNRIENLELWASKHCPGQRVSDLVVWAKEILARYNEPVVSPCCV